MIKRHFIKNLSIRNKIIAVILFVSLTVLSAGSALIVGWDVNRLKADMQSKLILEAKLIGDYCVVPLTFEDKRQAQEALSRMKLIESVEAGVLFDREGKVFAWYPDSLDVSTFRGNTEDGPAASLRGGRFTIREPIRFRGSLLGGLVMAASSKPLESRMRRLAMTVSAIVLALVLVSFVLATRLQAIISGPIVRLNAHFGRIAAAQDYSIRVARPSGDETGSLYDGFNELLETIEDQNREKKKLIDDLSASRAMQNTIFDAVPQSIFWKDKNGFYLGCNMTFAESAGLDHPDLIAGKTDDDLPWKKEAEKIRADDREVLRTGTHKYHTIEKLLKADGNSVWMDKAKIPLFNSEGEVQVLLGVFEDITEQRRAEEELKASEARYRFLFEQNPVPMLIYETGSLVLLAVNDAFIAGYGYSREEASKLLLPDLYPESEKKAIAGLAKTLKGHAYVGEWHHLKKDGTMMTIEARSHGFSFEGRPARIAVINDLTDRKEAEEALRRSEQRFKQLLESITDYTYSVEISGGCPVKTAHGSGCEKVTGFTPADYATDAQLWLRMVHSDDRRRVEHYADPLLEGKEIPAIEHRIIHKNGDVRWVRNTYVLKRDAGGRVAGYDGLISDITERKLAEDEIQKLNAELEDRVARRTAQLEAANKELEAFSYSVSHDLRAPLRHASGYVDLVMKKFKSDLNEKGRHYLNSIADSVHQMGVLIDDLLQFSRTGRTEMRMSRTDMDGLVRETAENLRRDNPGRAVEWTIAPLPAVFCDGSMLKLVWMNLMSNAVKFTRTRDKALIEIGAREADGETIFSVADNGVGFDMKYAQKLFGVFQRLHSMAEFEGTGIGLANVRRIITRHDGRTWAEARPDEGATFYFSLPKQPKET
jgi:PAS domain S-box-containing protein